MKKEYRVFVPDIKDLAENKEIKLTVKDLTPGRSKYSAHVVRAIVSSDTGRLPGADSLQVMSWTGVPYPGVWAIKIVKELEATEAGLPHGETIDAGQRK